MWLLRGRTGLRRTVRQVTVKAAVTATGVHAGSATGCQANETNAFTSRTTRRALDTARGTNGYEAFGTNRTDAEVVHQVPNVGPSVPGTAPWRFSEWSVTSAVSQWRCAWELRAC